MRIVLAASGGRLIPIAHLSLGNADAAGVGAGALHEEIAQPGLFKIFCTNPSNAKYVLDEFIVPKDSTAKTLADLKARNYTLAVATGKSRRGLNEALKADQLMPAALQTAAAVLQGGPEAVARTKQLLARLWPSPLAADLDALGAREALGAPLPPTTAFLTSSTPFASSSRRRARS